MYFDNIVFFYAHKQLCALELEQLNLYNFVNIYYYYYYYHHNHNVLEMPHHNVCL
jgi:hypothetical protein